MSDAEKIAELEERIERLEQIVERGAVPNMSDESDAPDNLDSRDAAVVGELEHGRSYSVSQLRRLYKQHTDIRNDSTAKERVKSLVQNDFFQSKNRRFIFRG